MMRRFFRILRYPRSSLRIWGSRLLLWGGAVTVALVCIGFAQSSIFGMTGYFTGVVQAPITAVVIIMEMTDDQALAIPLMATALIALTVSRLVCPQPIYRTLAQSFLEKQVRRRNREAAQLP